MKRKCVIYNRLTRGTFGDLANGTNELIEYCTNFLKIDDCEVFEELSPENGSRVSFDKMMEKIREKEFTDVLTFDISRYHRRNAKILGRILKEIDSYGVKIHFKNNKSTFYIRKPIADSPRLKNKIKEITDYYCAPDNMACFLGYEVGTYAGMKSECENISKVGISKI